MMKTSVSMETKFLAAVELLSNAASNGLGGTSLWRAPLRNDPGFDKKAEDDVWSLELWLDAHYMSLALSKLKRCDATERIKQHEMLVSAAINSYAHAQRLIENALTEIESLPGVAELSLEKRITSGEVRVISKRLSDYKIAFDTTIEYARHQEVRTDLMLQVIRNFEYLATSAAYDALVLRNRVFKQLSFVRRATRLESKLETSKRQQVALRKRLCPHFPPPNAAGDWTPKIVAEWLGLNVRIVRDRARQLSSRSSRKREASFKYGKQGERLVWNEAQMKRLVNYIRETTQAGRRGQL